MEAVIKRALLKLLYVLVKSGCQLPDGKGVMEAAGVLEDCEDSEVSDPATLLVKQLRKQMQQEGVSVWRLAQRLAAREAEIAADKERLFSLLVSLSVPRPLLLHSPSWSLVLSVSSPPFVSLFSSL
jgi:hypothetical protein